MASIGTVISLTDRISETLGKIEDKANNLADTLEKMDSRAGDVQKNLDNFSWSKFSKNAEKAGDKINDIGNKMSLALTAPILLLGKKSYSSATDYESAFAGVRKTTEATEEEFQAIYDSLLQLSEVEVPTDFITLSGTAEVAGQLGVVKEELVGFTKTVTDLQESTDIQGEQGTMDMAQFLNITEGHTGNVARIGGVIVDLGNNFATTESAILSMATRMASTANLAGFSSTEILALSAAMSSMGIESEAGGSSAGKLMDKMSLASEVGASGFEQIMEAANKANYAVQSMDDLQMILDVEGKDAKIGLAQDMGVSVERFDALMGAARDMEYFAKISGKSADIFQKDWNENPAQGMLDFFTGLAALDESGAQSAISTLNEMGITELRLSNMVKALTGNTAMFDEALAMAIAAYEVDPAANALAEEAAKRYETQESRNQMLGNKLENTMADLGQNIVEMLQPALEKANELLDWFNSFDESTQTGVITAFAVFAAAGPVTKAIGTTVSALGFVTKGVDKIINSESNWTSKIGGIFNNPTVWGVAAGAGAVALLIAALDSIPTTTETIISNLNDIQITVDEDSVNATLAAIEKVKEASDLLAGGAVTEEMENTSLAVQQGFGTKDTYGTALGYEQAKAEAEISGIGAEYAALIAAAQKELINAETEAEKADIFASIGALEAQADALLGEARSHYTQQISALFDGMASQYPEMAQKLETAAKQYDVLSAMWNYDLQAADMDDATRKAAGDEITQGLAGLGYMDESTLKLWLDGDNINYAGLIATYRDKLAAELSATTGEVSENPVLAGWLQSILSDPAMTENLDFSQLQGSLEGLVGALDFQAAGLKAAESGDLNQYGLYLVQGLAGGVDANAGLMDFTTVRDAALSSLQTVFDMHSPSQLMASYGVFLPEGLALGIDGGSPAVIVAINALGARANSAAAAAMSHANGYRIGHNMAQGMADGLRSGESAVTRAAQSVAQAAVQAARGALDIHSPSGVFRDMGLLTAQGYVQGLNRSGGTVRAAVGSLLSIQYKDYASDIWKTIGDFNELERASMLDKDDVQVSQEDIRRMRQLAEREIINRFTTAELSIEFTANNNISSDMDLDGVVAHLEDRVAERLEMAAEGVHS